jgi:hypothetical protein
VTVDLNEKPQHIAKTVPDWGRLHAEGNGIDCESGKCGSDLEGSENGKSACWFFVHSSDVA